MNNYIYLCSLHSLCGHLWSLYPLVQNESSQIESTPKKSLFGSIISSRVEPDLCSVRVRLYRVSNMKVQFGSRLDSTRVESIAISSPYIWLPSSENAIQARSINPGDCWGGVMGGKPYLAKKSHTNFCLHKIYTSI